MKLNSQRQTQLCLFVVGLIHEMGPQIMAKAESLQSQLINRCCQVGKERASASSEFSCKLSAREALLGAAGELASEEGPSSRNPLSAKLAKGHLSQPAFSDQCEMVLESCCLSLHRNKNCDAGRQLAREGAACMDVELSKEVTVATESFNDCCVACSLGMLAARTSQNDSLGGGGGGQQGLSQRCKLLKPLASSLSGQLYEQTYVECCKEHLPRELDFLHEPGSPVDCSAPANPCQHRCVRGHSGSGALGETAPSGRRRIAADRCECFTGYRIAADGITCEDIDECRSGTHTCNRLSEICDNIKGSFRCMARSGRPQLPVGPFLGAPSEAGGVAPSLEQEPPFASARLCPPNQRWSSAEGRCQPKAAAAAAAYQPVGSQQPPFGEAPAAFAETHLKLDERRHLSHRSASLHLSSQPSRALFEPTGELN